MEKKLIEDLIEKLKLMNYNGISLLSTAINEKMSMTERLFLMEQLKIDDFESAWKKIFEKVNLSSNEDIKKIQIDKRDVYLIDKKEIKGIAFSKEIKSPELDDKFILFLGTKATAKVTEIELQKIRTLSFGDLILINKKIIQKDSQLDKCYINMETKVSNIKVSDNEIYYLINKLNSILKKL